MIHSSMERRLAHRLKRNFKATEAVIVSAIEQVSEILHPDADAFSWLEIQNLIESARAYLQICEDLILDRLHAAQDEEMTA